MSQAGPELEVLYEEDQDQGLEALMAVINDDAGGAGSFEIAQGESERLGGGVPWAADIGFGGTSRFFTGGSVSTPAYIVIDPTTMEVVDQQQGFISGGTRDLYSAYLR